MWRFDAWAVRDGLAFVSDREAESITARATFFMSVPDLEPVPVGRISTALSATRANFQDGFRNREGDEFAFERIEEVQEVIRRGYLASGLGPTGAVTEAGEEPPAGGPYKHDYEPLPRITPPDSGSEHYEIRIAALADSARDMPDFSALADPGSRRDLLLTLHKRNHWRVLYPYLRAFGEATLLESVARYLATYVPEDRQLTQDWARVLVALGIWDSWADYDTFLISHHVYDYTDLRWSRYLYTDQLPAQDTVLRVACPRRPYWHSGIRVLGQKLLLPLSDREYYRANREVPEFIPLLLCSMAIVLSPALAVVGFESRALERHRLIARAFEWIETELPRVDLPADVEQELSGYGWGLLDSSRSAVIT